MTGPCLVGDDLVDLGDPAAAGAHLRARFVERVLGPAEREALEASARPGALLWAFFAAKEAAYKALAKLGPLPLAHRRFEVDPGLRQVRHGDTRLSLRVTEEAGWVHALAWLGPRAPVGAARALLPGEAPGAAARALLVELLGGGSGLAVVRDPRPGTWDGLGPPRVERAGRPLPVDVSLSHHGRFAGCALLQGATAVAGADHAPVTPPSPTAWR